MHEYIHICMHGHIKWMHNMHITCMHKVVSATTAHVYTCIHIHTCKRTFIHTNVHTLACMCAYYTVGFGIYFIFHAYIRYIYIHGITCMHMYVCVYIYIHIYIQYTLLHECTNTIHMHACMAKVAFASTKNIPSCIRTCMHAYACVFYKEI